MRTTILGNVAHVSPDVISGDDQEVQLSKLGQVFTAGWKQRLLLAGKLWRVSVFTLAADADIVPITGGGAGTFIELEQPELIVGVDAGYYLIPVEIQVAAYVNLIAGGQGQVATILATADTSVGIPTSATATTETPQNMLDGAGSFPGRAFSAVTADIADPGVEQLLAVESCTVMQIGTDAGPAIHKLGMHYQPDVPSILAGACSFSVYWGGDVAVGGACTAVFACVPSSWFPVS